MKDEGKTSEHAPRRLSLALLFHIDERRQRVSASTDKYLATVQPPSKAID